MTWPPPAGRTLLALHVAYAAPLAALAIWFGLVDQLPFGDGRCASCGVEGYVIAAHVVAAALLGAVVACLAAGRRELREGIRAPGRMTLGGLGAAAAFVAASLLWHALLNVPAFVAMLASIALFPVAGIWWLLSAVAWAREPPRDESELSRRYGRALAAAWLSLAVLLPATFAWVWTDRVDWLVF